MVGCRQGSMLLGEGEIGCVKCECMVCDHGKLREFRDPYICTDLIDQGFDADAVI